MVAHSRHVRSLHRAGFIAGLCYLAAIAPAMAQGTALELAVKATYLYKIAAFITWPPTAPLPPSFNICILGNDPFGPVLDQAIQGQTVDGRPVAAIRLRALPDPMACQMIYISDLRVQPAAVLAALRGKPVVTVTDGATDPSARGIINFIIADNRVRFEIDNGAAMQSHLTISSKLLSLAVRVRPSPLPDWNR